MIHVADFFDLLQGYGPRPCLESNDASYSYWQLLNEIRHWDSRLELLGGATPGSVMAIRADYSFSAISALLALMARQVTVALIPRGGETSRYLLDAHAAGLLDFDSKGDHRWHRLPDPSGHPLLERLRKAGESGIVIFTSGSTGEPKAALQSVERFLRKFRNARRCFRTLGFLLFDHVAGLDTLFYSLASGGTLVLTPSRDPQSVLKVIESCKVEVLPASPSFLRLLCVAKDFDQQALSSLRVITYGSEPMDPSTLARLNARFANAEISQKYGTTETGSPRAVSRSKDSLWLKFKEGVQTKVVDDVLWIRSESAILGYLNAPSPIDDEGWYCTGDLVDVDGEWIKFRGRLNDTFKVGGEKVAPAEVERVILELDFIRDVVVSGEPHPLMGSVVAAQVVLVAPDIDPNEAARSIRAHCRRRLALHKVPVRVDVTTTQFVGERQKRMRTPRRH